MLAPSKSFKHADGPATMRWQQGMVPAVPASLYPPARPTGMAGSDPVRPRILVLLCSSVFFTHA